MEVFGNGGSASLCGRVKTEVFENGGSASLCGRAKTEVFENDYVTGIGMSQLKKQNGCFLIRFRWCSVDGRKRYQNASVDEKLFIRFQETENGGFRKRISENGGVCLRKRRFSKTLSRVEVFENGGSASLCGRVKTEVFENDYVTGIGMSQLKKQNGCFLIRFRWCSVDGRKRYKNASVDEKLF